MIIYVFIHYQQNYQDSMNIQLKTKQHKLITENNMTYDEINIEAKSQQASRLKQLEGQCKIESFQPLKFDCLKTCLFIIPIIMSLVGLLLIKHFKKLRVKAFYKTCENEEAQYFYIETKDGNQDIEKVIKEGDNILVYFKNLKYQLRGKHLIPVGYQFQSQFSKITSKQYICSGLSNQNYQTKMSIYGKNQHKVEIPSYFEYIFDILTKPFFILQYIICIIFIFERLVTYTIINISFSVITTSINYYLLYVSYMKIKNMAEKQVNVEVIRNGQKITVTNHNLVPGDIVIPLENEEISFDGILISGQVFVNEASLTGQSIPIGKFPAKDISSTKKDTVWIVQGAKVLQARQDSRIVVINTGYSTRRGRIIRKILTRTTKVPDFFNSAIIFLIETFLVAIIIYFATLYLMMQGKIITTFLIFRFFDYLGWSFPPTFPIFFNISYSFSLVRLKWKNIFGTEPQKVTQASNVKTFFFDKTGTLTQNQIEVYQIYKFADNKHHNITETINTDINNNLIQKLFASCHTVREIDNNFLGDQVDLRMFLYSEYKMKLTEDKNIRFIAENNQNKIQVLRINQFQSKFQNMSVLVRDNQLKKYYVFVKGAPEKIQTNSTVKISSYYDLVSTLSLGGYRTIGYGYKQISQSEVNKYLDGQRQIFDTNILALGLVAFQNKLKSDTRQTIDKLIQSDIVPKMITGDNIFIAVQTGFRAGILKQGQKIILLEGRKQTKKQNRHFQGILLYKKGKQIVQESIDFSQKQYETQTAFAIAVDNDFFNMSPRPYVTQYIKLFARISPENKANIVKTFKDQQKTAFENRSCSERWFGAGVQKVGMCGDGANDLMAIRQADVGIGISDSDASYAACFTISKMLDVQHIVRQSKNANQSIVDMIRYFGTINFIKIVASILLVTDVTYYTSNQTTFFNFAHSVWLTVAFSLSSPHQLPTKKRPLCNFLSLYNHLIYWINIAFPTLGMCLAYYYFRSTTSYTINPIKTVTNQNGYEGTMCTTNTIVWLLLNFVLILNAFVLYKGEPFKSKFYKNIPIMILTLVNFVIIVAFFFNTSKLGRGLGLHPIYNYQSGICLVIIASSMIVNFMVTYIIKKLFDDE